MLSLSIWMKNRQRLKDTLTSIKYFYREYTAYNLIFTFIGLYFLLTSGAIAGIWVFWIKVFGYLFLAVIFLRTRRKFLYFFHNLGSSLLFLFTSSITIDCLITLTIYSFIFFFE